jgi:hypothetical protein
MVVKFNEFIIQRYEKITAGIKTLEKELSDLALFNAFRFSMMETEKKLREKGGEQLATYVALLNKLGLKTMWPEEQEARDFLDELDMFQQKSFDLEQLEGL